MISQTLLKQIKEKRGENLHKLVVCRVILWGWVIPILPMVANSSPLSYISYKLSRIIPPSNLIFDYLLSVRDATHA